MLAETRLKTSLQPPGLSNMNNFHASILKVLYAFHVKMCVDLMESHTACLSVPKIETMSQPLLCFLRSIFQSQSHHV